MPGELSAREALSVATELLDLASHLDALRAFANRPGHGRNIHDAIARLADPIENRLVVLLTVTKPIPNREKQMTDTTPSRAPLMIADYTPTEEWSRKQERHIHRIFDAFDGLSEDRQFPEASLTQLILELVTQLPPHRQVEIAHLLVPTGIAPAREIA